MINIIVRKNKTESKQERRTSAEYRPKMWNRKLRTREGHKALAGQKMSRSRFAPVPYRTNRATPQPPAIAASVQKNTKLVTRLEAFSPAVRLGTAMLFADTPRVQENELCSARTSAECKICNMPSFESRGLPSGDSNNACARI